MIISIIFHHRSIKLDDFQQQLIIHTILTSYKLLIIVKKLWGLLYDNFHEFAVIVFKMQCYDNMESVEKGCKIKKYTHIVLFN